MTLDRSRQNGNAASLLVTYPGPARRPFADRRPRRASRGLPRLPRIQLKTVVVTLKSSEKRELEMQRLGHKNNHLRPGHTSEGEKSQK